MSARQPSLMVQFLAWVAARPRTYSETMDAWRTSCPRLSIWEDATEEGLVETLPYAGAQSASPVALTPEGEAALQDAG